MPTDDALHEWQQRCYQLVTENEELAQQLAQAREELAAERAHTAKVQERWEPLQAEIEAALDAFDQARALLEESASLIALARCADVLRTGTETPLYDEIRAFLAEHPAH